MKFFKILLILIYSLCANFQANAAISVIAKSDEFIVKIKKNRLFFLPNANQIGSSSFYLLKTKSKSSIVSVRSKLKTLNSDVEYIEPNYIYHSTDTTYGKSVVNDVDFRENWNLQNLYSKNADIHIVDLWREGIVGNQKTIVAIIDSGIDYHHPDLKKNIYTNSKEIPDNGIDDDGNGYIDDIHGWNFVDNNSNANDDNGHGTHCAGTIGAEANNSFGIAGINWNVSILPLKFLDSQGYGETKNAILAIEYARKMGAKIINASWGGDPFSQALSDAIQEANSDNILFVTSAGNNGMNNDLTPFYPASLNLPNVISVAASNESDKIANYSNYGQKSVHISAPGNNIFSTALQDGFETLSGTSMAAPHISGIAALLISQEPNLTPALIKERLIKSSDPVNVIGRVNAYNAVHRHYPIKNTRMKHK